VNRLYLAIIIALAWATHVIQATPASLMRNGRVRVNTNKLSKFFCRSSLVVLLVWCSSVDSVQAATRFVRGYSDGIWVYGVIERDGHQYRTDQMAPKFNQHLWDELSSDDKIKLAKSYGWWTNSMKVDFGEDGRTAIRVFFNDQTGWSDVINRLKDKRANKEYPELAAAFGDGVTLDVPFFDPTCWEVRNSAAFEEAVRLRHEVQADFLISREIYLMLRNAEWDKVSVAIKTLTPPLIKTIVSTFITGFVTHGAAAVSDLMVTVHGFREDLKSFIYQRYSEGSKQPDPTELIKKIDKYLDDMEQSALTGKDRVAAKINTLQSLAADIQILDDDCVSARQASAADTISGLQTKIDTLPAADTITIVADPVPDNPDINPAEWLFNNMHQKALTRWSSISGATSTLKQELTNEKGPILNQFNAVSIPGLQGTAFEDFYAGLTSGFDDKYRDVDVESAVFDSWDFSSTGTACVAAQNTYHQSELAALSHIDDSLPEIDLLNAQALAMDVYAGYLGTRDAAGNITPMNPPPSEVFLGSGIRDFDSMVNIIATPTQKLTAVITDLGAKKEIIDRGTQNLGTGIANRREWVKDQYRKYESLLFNFENSLSYVIAALTQIDQLHGDDYFSGTVYARYDGIDLYKYSVDVDYILNEINTLGIDSPSLQGARQAAIRRLFELSANEQALIQKLIIAQDSHMNDVQAMDNFFDTLSAHYSGVYSIPQLIADVAAITGKTMKTRYEQWHDLVPNNTYYYLGDGNWIRTPDKLGTVLLARDIYFNPSPYGRISGKTSAFFDLLELHDYMENEKATLLALSLAAFNEFMTQTTTKIDAYQSRLTADEVFAPGWPAWQLSFAINQRKNSLNDEYRYGLPEEKYQWTVKGNLMAPGGVGVPGVDLILDGYYGTDGTGSNLTFAATTGVNGFYRFDFVGTGNFTISAYQQAGGSQSNVQLDKSQSRVQAAESQADATESNSAGYNISPVAVEVRGADINVDVVALPTPESGYYAAGHVLDQQAQGIGGVSVSLKSTGTGNISSILTGEDGTFDFTGLPAGNWKIYPTELGKDANPLQQMVTLPSSVAGLEFVVVNSCDFSTPTGSCDCGSVSGVIDSGTTTHESCQQLVIGPDYLAENGADVTFSSGLGVWLKPGLLVEKGATLDIYVCGQSLCAISQDPMPYGCHSCVSQICTSDPSCCTTGFDQTCLDSVSTVCGLVCE